MKVLVVGSGGRCHAIVDKISQSKLVKEIYCAPGNDGMRELCNLVDISATDVDKLLEFALENKIDLTIVGPEVALEKGIVDVFRAHNLKIFGPTKAAARIETSKEFAKELMKKYNIPTASFKTFTDYEKACAYVDEKGAPIVIKYDGLAAGKGVVVANTIEEAKQALKDMLLDEKFGNDDKVVIEEYLEGPEFSFMCMVDNDKVYPLPLSQDHKRALDNDKGGNTGGMGAYSPLKFITSDDFLYSLDRIMKPVANALVKEGCPFTGILYGGLMKTENGIKVIEFNARFGDPETEVILPRLENDLVQSILNILDHKDPEIIVSNDTTIGIVMASNGYPASYNKMYSLELDKIAGKVYYMGVKEVEGKLYTNGGRVLIIVEKAADLATARALALEDVKHVHCSNLFYRTDIGHWSL
ncbi:MAG: phosphoribosylamine--glycine ligase [Acholeplasmatales bacterium]|nr:phosphoribosylamine--glycine ligase [Acholeplasmatales bacterium]